MNFWTVAVWSLIIVTGLAALYGLHRLGLWLEERGWLFYKHKKPSSSAVCCFVAHSKRWSRRSSMSFM